MKKTILIALTCLPLVVKAQTNSPSISGGISQIGSAISGSTNWTVTTGWGRALTGNRSLYFGDVAYNFTENVGVVVGFDYLYGRGLSQFNDVRGGVTLSAQIHPFAFLGSTFLTNVVATPFVADMLATPRDNNPLGNLLVTGAKFEVYAVKNWELGVLAAYENRTGQGVWDANYGLVGVTFSRKW